MSHIYALIDCNNFFASCERVFHPGLRNKPIVVLSNNDGCVIARSNESKQIGIKMGEPYFKCEHLLKKYKVQVYSCNFPLYGDMSRRVMEIVSQFARNIEIYSIDEAFLYLSRKLDFVKYSQKLRKTVQKSTGIPISVGIAPTKTLAKIANHLAKKVSRFSGVCNLVSAANIDQVLQQVPVGSVWGVGRKYTEFLNQHHVHTAFDLKNVSDKWVRKHLHVPGLRTVWELRGTPCISLSEKVEPRKGILTSRSFRHPIQKYAALKEAIATFISRGAEKLREQGSLASYVHVFLQSNRFHRENYYSNSFTINLPQPTSYTSLLIHQAHKGLKEIFKTGYGYKRAGIMLTGLISKRNEQLNLFDSEKERLKKEILMDTVDTINSKWGIDCIKYAAAGVKTNWRIPSLRKSARFTTRWDEVLEVKL